MKTIIALAALGLLSTTAFAYDEGCNPSQGNWVNAAVQSCAVSDASHTGDPARIERKVKEEPPEETSK